MTINDNAPLHLAWETAATGLALNPSREAVVYGNAQIYLQAGTLVWVSCLQQGGHRWSVVTIVAGFERWCQLASPRSSLP